MIFFRHRRKAELPIPTIIAEAEHRKATREITSTALKKSEELTETLKSNGFTITLYRTAGGKLKKGVVS